MKTKMDVREAQEDAADMIITLAEERREFNSITNDGDLYCLRDDMNESIKLLNKIQTLKSVNAIRNALLKSYSIVERFGKKEINRIK